MSDVSGTIVTPGNHDGVHLGHRALLAAARELGSHVTALTFDPHPAVVLAPSKAPPLLTTPTRRAQLLRELGADAVEVLAFDEALAAMSPEAFVREVLVDRLGAAGVVLGPDFRFGKGRSGDVDTLRALGATHGFEVRTVPPVQREGGVVSSTRIRRLVQAGEVDAARRLLGRVHDAGGRVVRGDQRGRTIGFPTANLDCESVLLPADGVYAVVMRVDGDLHRGVANLGVRPTFAAGRSVEAHLFDFDGDLYDRDARVGFVKRIRGERKFDGIEALKAQIATDAAAARQALDEADTADWALV